MADEGKKFDGDKLRWDLVPQHELDDLVAVLTYGAKKYGDENWRNVKARRYYAAAMRHISAWRRGQWQDEESGLPHLAHAMCSIMFISALERPVTIDKEGSGAIDPFAETGEQYTNRMVKEFRTTAPPKPLISFVLKEGAGHD